MKDSIPWTARVVTFMNPAAEELFGWTFDELRGRNIHDAVHYKHPDGSPFPVEECPICRCCVWQDLTAHEDVFIRKDGTFFDVVYSSSPLREDGNITGLVVVFRDVTARKKPRKRCDRRTSNWLIAPSSFKLLLSHALRNWPSLTNGFAMRWTNAKPCVASYFTHRKKSDGASLASCTIRWDRI